MCLFCSLIPGKALGASGPESVRNFLRKVPAALGLTQSIVDLASLSRQKKAEFTIYFALSGLILGHTKVLLTNNYSEVVFYFQKLPISRAISR